MASNVIIVDQLSHAYQAAQALQNVSFDVSEGSLFGLLGPNGSGKTTLFRLLSTLLPLQQGIVTICGLNLASEPSRIRRRIGVTFQSPALDVRLTVRENLNCHAALYGLNRKSTRIRIDELLQRFRIADRIESIVGTLSGGLKRRVELVKGLLHSPQLLLLDEPTTGLDVRSRLEFFQMLDDQRQYSGTTIVLATHLMEEAELCDQLLLLDRGRVVQQGSPDQLKSAMDGERLTIRCLNPEHLRPILTRLVDTEPSQTGNELIFRVADPASLLPRILQYYGDQILSLQISKPSLEDVFLSFTGRLLSTSDAATVPEQEPGA